MLAIERHYNAGFDKRVACKVKHLNGLDSVIVWAIAFKLN